MKRIILIATLGLLAFTGFSQTPVSRNTLTTTPYSWYARQVPTLTYLKNTFYSFHNVIDDGYPWVTTGNTLGANSRYIGTNDNRSLRFVTNGVQRMKLDSLGFFTWDMGSSGSPLYYNNFSLRPLPTFTQIPVAYMCVKDYRADNYCFLADTTNFIVNANRGLFFRCHNFTWMQAYTSFVNNQSGNADGAQINGVNTVTMTSNGVTTAHMTPFRKIASTITYSLGTVPTERGFYIQGDVHNAMSASTATITEDIGMEVTHPSAGAGLTQTNRLALASFGHFNVWGKIWVSGANGARSVTTPTAFVQVGAQTNAAPGMQFASGTILTTTLTGAVEYAGNVWYLTNNVARYEVGLVLKGSGTLNFGNTAAGASTDLTITVTGAADGDPVMVGSPNASTNANGIFTAWVSAANTVTVRFTNTNLVTAIDPASGTFKVTVNKN